MTVEFGAPEQAAAARLVELALPEDLGEWGDVTSRSLLPAERQGHVQLLAREGGILCGLPIGQLVLGAVDPVCTWTPHSADGDEVRRGTCAAMLTGSVRSLLTAERTILNFLTHLSGVATLTRRFVDAVRETKVVILDTRKTLPGWRVLQKYAVRCGGGTNHRMGLGDAVLIKDNHLAALRGCSLADVVRRARRGVPERMPVEIEVDSLEQLVDALEGGPDALLLDNMGDPLLREAVALRDRLAPGVLLEASGGITLQNVGEIARTGVDRISIGRLTHSAPALDLAFDWSPIDAPVKPAAKQRLNMT